VLLPPDAPPVHHGSQIKSPQPPRPCIQNPSPSPIVAHHLTASPMMTQLIVATSGFMIPTNSSHHVRASEPSPYRFAVTSSEIPETPGSVSRDNLEQLSSSLNPHRQSATDRSLSSTTSLVSFSNVVSVAISPLDEESETALEHVDLSLWKSVGELQSPHPRAARPGHRQSSSEHVADTFSEVFYRELGTLDESHHNQLARPHANRQTHPRDGRVGMSRNVTTPSR
jgi:hypothetical protein